MPTDIELSYRLLLSLHSIIAVSVYPSLINSWTKAWHFGGDTAPTISILLSGESRCGAPMVMPHLPLSIEIPNDTHKGTRKMGLGLTKILYFNLK